MIESWLALAGLSKKVLARIVRTLAASEPRSGRPHAHSLEARILLACIALRTNLTLRELAALAHTSKSTAHRILRALVPRLAACARVDDGDGAGDRRFSWIVDGTLIPTRDHSCSAKSKNYRWSCNAQVLVRRTDLRVIATVAGGPENRNDTVHYRGSVVQRLAKKHGRVLADGGYRGVAELRTPRFRGRRIVRDSAWRQHRRKRARVEHAIARLKNWRVLRDHRGRGRHLDDTLRAVAVLHNLQIELRDNP